MTESSSLSVGNLASRWQTWKTFAQNCTKGQMHCPNSLSLRRNAPLILQIVLICVQSAHTATCGNHSDIARVIWRIVKALIWPVD